MRTLPAHRRTEHGTAALLAADPDTRIEFHATDGSTLDLTDLAADLIAIAADHRRRTADGDSNPWDCPIGDIVVDPGEVTGAWIQHADEPEPRELDEDAALELLALGVAVIITRGATATT
jgi:hypothetical protein